MPSSPGAAAEPGAGPGFARARHTSTVTSTPIRATTATTTPIRAWATGLVVPSADLSPSPLAPELSGVGARLDGTDAGVAAEATVSLASVGADVVVGARVWPAARSVWGVRWELGWEALSVAWWEEQSAVRWATWWATC